MVKPEFGGGVGAVKKGGGGGRVEVDFGVVMEAMDRYTPSFKP
jgi:hypothetical protein